MADRPFTLRLAAASLLAATMLAAPALADENRLLPQQEVATASIAAAAGNAAPLSTAATLVPFEQAPSTLQLTGEDDSLHLTFAVSDRLRAAGGKLQLAYTNAVSVLPDTAQIEVTVNDEAIGTFPIRSPNGVATVSLPLGANVLKAGRNRVTLRAIQHHRVDCSLAATYELWTKLSADRSGFLAAAMPDFSAAEELLSVQRNGAGVTDIRLIAPVDAPVALINQAMPAVQSLALALNRRDVAVTVAAEPGTGPGIDLYIGEAGQAGQSPAAQRALASAAPGLSVQRTADPARAAVVLRGGNRQELDAGLLAALRGPLANALQTGILAPRVGGVNAQPGMDFTLAETGYQAQPFGGRLSHTHFTMTMPADFYPADYDTMKFFLSGATAPGLLPGSQFLIRVNDRIVTSLPFRNTDGELFRRKPIEMPLRAFRPGVNRVELLAEVPAPSDAACRPTEREDGKPRFMLLKESAIEVPALARIGRLPDLGAFTGKGYPYDRGKPFAVILDRPGKEGLATAATVVTRLALAAGKPVDAALSYGSAAQGVSGDAIAIISSTGQARVHDAAVRASSGQANPAAPGIDTTTTTATGHAGAVFSAGSEELLDAFQQSTATHEGKSMNARVQEWFGQVSNRFNSWLRYQDAPEGAIPEERDTLVSITQREAASGEGVLTTIRAARPEDLARGFAILAEPQNWERLEGEKAIVRADDGTLVTHLAEHRFVREITDESFGNFRRLAASWFSDNFQIYVGLVVGLFVVFGLWLGVYVPKKGVASK